MEQDNYLLDPAVEEVIRKLVSNPKFAELMQSKIDMKLSLDNNAQNETALILRAYSVSNVKR